MEQRILYSCGITLPLSCIALASVSGGMLRARAAQKAAPLRSRAPLLCEAAIERAWQSARERSNEKKAAVGAPDGAFLAQALLLAPVRALPTGRTAWRLALLP